MPELSKTAKSPNSCGNSSHNTAALTLIPVKILSVKAAPIERPSIKLCTPSPKMIIHATVAIFDPCVLFSKSRTVSTVGRLSALGRSI